MTNHYVLVATKINVNMYKARRMIFMFEAWQTLSPGLHVAMTYAEA